MGSFSYMLVKLVQLLSFLLNLYLWVVIIRAFLSWVRPDPYSPIVRFINNLVDPVTERIAKIIPTRVGMVDLAPLILIVIIHLIQSYLLPVVIEGFVELR
jgi:YggT family protein